MRLYIIKSVLFFTVALFLVSCGNSKLRFKRVRLFDRQEIVTVSDDTDSARQNETTHSKAPKQATLSQLSEQEKSLGITVDQTTTSPAVFENSDEGTAGAPFPSAPTDTLINYETEEKLAIALRAEKFATYGTRLLNIIVLVLLICSVTALLLSDWLPLIVGMICGALLALSSIILGVASKLQPYTTKLGARRSSKSIFVGFILFTLMGLFAVSWFI